MDGTKTRKGSRQTLSRSRTAPLKPKPGLNGPPAQNVPSVQFYLAVGGASVMPWRRKTSAIFAGQAGGRAHPFAPRRGMPRLRPEQVGAEEPHFPQSHRDAGTPGSRSSEPFRVVIGAVEIVSGFVLLEFSLGRGGRGFCQQCGDFALTHWLESTRGVERLIKDLH